MNTDGYGTGTYTYNPTENAWRKIKIVADMTDESAEYTSYRVYIDGQLVKTSDGTNDFADLYPANGKKFSDTFHGLFFGGYAYNARDGYQLYDNVKAYTIGRDFEVSYDEASFTEFVKGDSIELSFTTDVDANTVSNIYLADSTGAKVENGVTATVDPTNATKVIVTFGSVASGNFKVVIPAEFTDIYGQGIGTKGAETKEIEATMAKGSEIYVDDVTDGYDAATGTFTKTITVNSVAATDLPVWITAAAYDSDNNMIGFVDVGNAFTLGAGLKAEKSLTFTVATGKTAKYIRVFVWNGANTMKPYQAAEEIVIE